MDGLIFIMENPLKMDDLEGFSLFLETSTSFTHPNAHLLKRRSKDRMLEALPSRKDLGSLGVEKSPQKINEVVPKQGTTWKT